MKISVFTQLELELYFILKGVHLNLNSYLKCGYMNSPEFPVSYSQLTATPRWLLSLVIFVIVVVVDILVVVVDFIPSFFLILV